MTNFSRFLLLALLGLPLNQTLAADDPGNNWNGVWLAEGTFFSVGVTVRDNQIVVSEVESLGFEWTAKAGIVGGNVANIEVEYAGATAMIQVQLLDAGTATAKAVICRPEYLVVCALAADRQARFLRVGPLPETD